jgi:uncharacterized integral membrane protein
MRALKALIALLFLLAGAVLGVLNQQTVVIDLLFSQMQVRLGLLVLSCVFFGALMGGALVSLGIIFKKTPLLPSKSNTAENGPTP